MSIRKFAVIGHPIGHTMSPFIHQRLFALAGQEDTYTVLDIAPDAFAEKMAALDELAGYNVTIPYKQTIIPFLDQLDPRAALYGSVNTVRNGSVREGFTTDPDGFLKALEAARIPLSGYVVILGCGGVARTFAYEALRAGCSVTLAVRPQSAVRRDALIQELHSRFPQSTVSGCLLQTLDIAAKIDLLVNATPVGMYPHTDAMPVSDKVLSRCHSVFDAIYNPLETTLLKAAKAHGAATADGMAMLVWQAVAAHEIWDGTRYRTEEIGQLIEDSAEELKKKF